MFSILKYLIFIQIIYYTNSKSIHSKNYHLINLHDCQKIFQQVNDEFIECITYKLITHNAERLGLDDDQVIKPVLRKSFENTIVNNGENVTFSCEAQNEPIPTFLLYKLILNVDNEQQAVFLQDPNHFDYVSTFKNIIIERREHHKDPNRDTNSEFEQINMRIINTTYDDCGYYLCIVANSAKSYRSTYAYLNVTEFNNNLIMNNNDNDDFMIDNHGKITNNKFERFIRDNKYIIISFIIAIAIIIILFMILIVYCCSSHLVKRNINKLHNKNEKSGLYLDKNIIYNENNNKLSNMNSIIEKTFNNMKKNFVYVAMDNGNNSVNSTLSQRVNLIDAKTLNNNVDLYVNQNVFESMEDGGDWEFPRDKLKLGKLIDEGAFGRVFMAEAFGIIKGRYKTIVAVKTLKENPSNVEFNNFIKELDIMKNVGKHENIISLLGCCTKNGDIYAIVEYAKYGNLRNYLRSQRPKDYMLSTSSYNTSDIEGEEEEEDTLSNNIKKLYSTVNKKPIESRQEPTATKHLLIELVKYCTQISNGMKYLHSKRVCHRDLAARNILMDENKVCKIADFGLARDLQDCYYYKRKTEMKVPVKWMAPETLFDHKVYPNSDIWSFGVLMWEVFTLGGNPYPTVPVEKLFDYLKEGNRMSKPMYCDDEIYGIMLECWNFKSDSRPSFSTINEKLMYIHEKYETELANETLNINLNTPTLSLNFTNAYNSTSSNNSKLLSSTENSATLVSPKPFNFDLNKQILLKRFTNNNADSINRILCQNEKRYTTQSESEDSQYVSGTDMSNSILYVDSSNFSTGSSHYSEYATPPTESIKAASIMMTSLNKRPPSPPPPQTLQDLLNVASKVSELN